MSDRILTRGDVVTAFVYRRGKSRAECSCGWEGRKRIFRGIAVVDALEHAHRQGCAPDWPLVCRAEAPTKSLFERLTPPVVIAASPLLLILAVLWAPEAHADPMGYLNALESDGISVYSPGEAVTAGYRICNELNIASGDVVAARVYNTFYDVTSMPQAETMVVDSVENLCPWHDHRGDSLAAVA